VRKSFVPGIGLLLFCLSIFNLNVAAQSVDAAQFATVKAFNLNAATLPPNFTGTDPAAVWELLKTSPALKGKSEFETEREYKDRLEHGPSPVLSAGVTAADPIAFMTSTSPGALEVTYDAEHREYQFGVETNHIDLLGGAKSESIPATSLRFKIDRESNYAGENAMGATVQVARTSATEFLLAPRPFRSLPKKVNYPFESSKLSIKLPLPPEEARHYAKDNFRVLIIGTLERPYTGDGFLSGQPTFSDPNELYVTQNVLYVRVQAVWVYEIKTGQILAKFS
jgi:hypothetical protein